MSAFAQYVEDTAPVLTILQSTDYDNHAVQMAIARIWREGNPREAVYDGVNLSVSGAGHWAALELYHASHWPTLDYDKFLDELDHGALAGGLMHGYYDKNSHTFFWDRYYGVLSDA